MRGPLPAAAVREVRAFGWTFLAAGVAFGLRALWTRRPLAVAALWGLAGALVWVLSRVSPTLVRPVERGWMALGRAIGRVTTPVLLGVVFVGVVVPLRAALWVLRRDPLGVRRDPAATTYWIERPHTPAVREDFERLS